MQPRTRRTLQLLGGGSYSITLPKSWVKSNGLEEGDQLLIEVEDDGSLLIAPESKARARPPASLRILNNPLVVRDVLGGYLFGYDHIVIESKTPLSPEVVSEIRKRIRGLTGAEIIDEGPNRLEVQILLDTEAVEPTKVLTRQNALVKSMINDAVSAFVEGDRDRAQRAVYRDEEVDRHYFTLVRVVRAAIQYPELSRRLDVTPLRLLDIRLVAKFLEDIGDKAVNIASLIFHPQDTARHSQLMEFIKQIGNNLVETQNYAFEAFLNSDPTLASRVISNRDVVERLIGEAVSTAKHLGQDSINALYACLNLDRISEDQVDIADISAPISGLGGR